MKNLLCISMIIICGIFKTNAQSDAGDFTMAPQIGVNFSTYTSEADYNFRTSVALGVVAEYYFSNRWSLRTGLQYDTMGAEDSFGNHDKLDYITLPINASYHFGKNRNWYLNFGPALAFLVSANAELNDGSKFKINDMINDIDVGFTAGIGYKFDVNEDLQLFIDYQGFNGFLDVDDQQVLPFAIRNARSALNFGAIFNL